METGRLPEKDRPWLIRTYAGHSTAEASNQLYRTNLAKGQTGLSVAFDLPTQTGYDSDHVLARGEVGKVGVPINNLGAMRALFDGIPLTSMNTSMTINAPAMFMLAMYQVVAEEQAEAAREDVAAAVASLRGTTQNDIVKEYLSRGTYAFPPGPSMRLTADVIAYTVNKMPQWNPINVCSYHLQEAGAAPVQEVAFSLATAMAVLDEVKSSGQVSETDFPAVVGRISFFCNAGVRFIEELCKMRAFVELWDEITRDRYGVTDPKLRRFRYGVQVNSLGLTEAQPENNVQRIVLEMLGVTLSRDARARSVQLPAWNEALGLPRPWDQQWSLRIQQVLAHESDLLEYPDIFAGSVVVENLTQQMISQVKEKLEQIEQAGGVAAAVDSGLLKGELVASMAARTRRIESGEQIVVGVNKFTTTEASPLTENLEDSIQTVDPAVESQARERVQAWRASRDEAAAQASLARLQGVARSTENLMEATLACVRAGVTIGEWTGALRGVFGEFQAPTGVSGSVGFGRSKVSSMTEIREQVQALEADLGRRLRILVAKPGLDGHSNGAEQIAVRARDAGFEVIYQGIRQTPAQIIATAVAEDVDLVGLSILSGSHLALVPEVLTGLRDNEMTCPVIVGGIIPAADAAILRATGVAAIYTPKDVDLNTIMADFVRLIRTP